MIFLQNAWNSLPNWRRKLRIKRSFFFATLVSTCLTTIAVWVDTVAVGRTNLPPSKVPFDAISTLMSESVYGGRIANDFDADCRLVTEGAFSIAMPDANKREQFWGGSTTSSEQRPVYSLGDLEGFWQELSRVNADLSRIP